MLAAVKDGLGPKRVNRVDLALWPLAAESYSGLEFDYTQYDQLIVQSLLYTLSGPCMPSPPPLPSLITQTTKLDLSVENQTVCDLMPDVAALMNATFGLPPGAVVTQSISVGAALGAGTHQVNVTVSESGSTIVVSVDVTANEACHSPGDRPVPAWVSIFSMLWAFASGILDAV